MGKSSQILELSGAAVGNSYNNWCRRSGMMQSIVPEPPQNLSHSTRKILRGGSAVNRFDFFINQKRHFGVFKTYCNYRVSVASRIQQYQSDLFDHLALCTLESLELLTSGRGKEAGNRISAILIYCLKIFILCLPIEIMLIERYFLHSI